MLALCHLTFYRWSGRGPGQHLLTAEDPHNVGQRQPSTPMKYQG
jgi:hypothetical protein